MAKIINRIAQFIEYKQISMTEFDKQISASNGYIGKLLRNNGSVGSDVLEKIVSIFPELDATWLLTGHGSMLKGKTTRDVLGNIFGCEFCATKDKKILELQEKLIKCQEQTIELINNSKNK